MKKINQILEKLICTDRPLAFLVGAGISIPAPSSMLSGKEFNEQIIKKIAPNREIRTLLLQLCDSERFDRLNKGDFLRFEGLMQTLYENVDPKLDILDYLDTYNNPNTNHYILATLLKLGNKILTTNFDLLIEHACKLLEIDICSIITEKEFKTYERSNINHPLFKLHGSLKKYNGKKWVNSKHSVEATLEAVCKSGSEMSFEPSKRNLLSNILKQHDLVILGYSGYDDFDIIPMLQSIKSDKKIIWINHSYSNRIINWKDLTNAPKDKDDYFLRKREEFLFNLGKSTRKSDNIFLFELDTSTVFEMLARFHKIALPQLNISHQFESQQFFTNWENNHIKNESYKYFICGRIFHSLQRLELSLENYYKSMAIAGDLLDKRKISENLYQIATIHKERGDYDTALELYKKSIILKEELYEESGKAECLGQIGDINMFRGNYNEALNYFQKSLIVYKKIKDKKNTFRCLQGIGVVYLFLGDYSNALTNFKKSLLAFQKLGDQSNACVSLLNIGITYQELKKYDNALEHYQKSLSIAEELGNRDGISRCLHQIGIICEFKLDFQCALKNHHRSLEIFEELNNKRGISASLHHIGKTHKYKMEYNKAMKYFQRSLEISEEMGDKLSIAECLYNIGQIFSINENYEKAIYTLQQATMMFKELNSPYFNECKNDLEKIQDKKSF